VQKIFQGKTVFLCMLIGNPLYDTVFKFMMEDLRSAKKFVSLIINEQVEDLQFFPQEQVHRKPGADDPWLLTLYRIDFSATIRTVEGQLKKVVIEVQKAYDRSDIIRFRKYLGYQYQNAHTEHEDASQDEDILPIICIYVLGFKASNAEVPVLKTLNGQADVLSGKQIDEPIEFLELLTHNAYLIQVPYLRASLRSPLEQMLALFDQRYKVNDPKYLLDVDFQFDDPDLVHMLNRLRQVAGNKELKQKIALEEEVRRKDLKTNNKIAKANQERDAAELARDEERKKREQLEVTMVNALHKAGLSIAAIAKETGLTEVQVGELVGKNK